MICQATQPALPAVHSKPHQSYKENKMSKNLRVGVIGCGNISTAYFTLAPMFCGLTFTACADMNMATAQAQATKFGLKAMSDDDLLASGDIDVVVNLTIPAAHFPITKAILQSGKNVYPEKPLVLTIEQGLELRDIANASGLIATKESRFGFPCFAGCAIQGYAHRN